VVRDAWLRLRERSQQPGMCSAMRRELGIGPMPNMSNSWEELGWEIRPCSILDKPRAA